MSSTKPCGPPISMPRLLWGRRPTQTPATPQEEDNDGCESDSTYCSVVERPPVDVPLDDVDMADVHSPMSFSPRPPVTHDDPYVQEPEDFGLRDVIPSTDEQNRLFDELLKASRFQPVATIETEVSHSNAMLDIERRLSTRLNITDKVKELSREERRARRGKERLRRVERRVTTRSSQKATKCIGEDPVADVTRRNQPVADRKGVKASGKNKNRTGRSKETFDRKRLTDLRRRLADMNEAVRMKLFYGGSPLSYQQASDYLLQAQQHCKELRSSRWRPNRDVEELQQVGDKICVMLQESFRLTQQSLTQTQTQQTPEPECEEAELNNVAEVNNEVEVIDISDDEDDGNKSWEDIEDAFDRISIASPPARNTAARSKHVGHPDNAHYRVKTSNNTSIVLVKRTATSDRQVIDDQTEANQQVSQQVDRTGLFETMFDDSVPDEVSQTIQVNKLKRKADRKESQNSKATQNQQVVQQVDRTALFETISDDSEPDEEPQTIQQVTTQQVSKLKRKADRKESQNSKATQNQQVVQQVDRTILFETISDDSEPDEEPQTIQQVNTLKRKLISKDPQNTNVSQIQRETANVTSKKNPPNWFKGLIPETATKLLSKSSQSRNESTSARNTQQLLDDSQMPKSTTAANGNVWFKGLVTEKTSKSSKSPQSRNESTSAPNTQQLLDDSQMPKSTANLNKTDNGYVRSKGVITKRVQTQQVLSGSLVAARPKPVRRVVRTLRVRHKLGELAPNSDLPASFWLYPYPTFPMGDVQDY